MFPSEPSVLPGPPIVLIVEDDPDTRDLYQTVFEAEGFWVAVASDADSGLVTAADVQPDVIVTDVTLRGEGDGSTMVGVLRRLDKTAHIPVIAVTGWNRRKVPDDGFVEVLQKPVTLDVLVGTVRRVLTTTSPAKTATAANDPSMRNTADA